MTTALSFDFFTLLLSSVVTSSIFVFFVYPLVLLWLLCIVYKFIKGDFL